MSEDPILAAIDSLRTEIAGLRTDFLAELGKTRGEIMERLDRHQTRLDVMDEHLTMGLGYTDRVDRKLAGLSEDNRLLGELQMSLTNLLRRLEGRVNKLEG